MHDTEIILTIKEGDTEPTVQYQLDEVNNLEDIDGVRFYLQHQTTGTLVVNDEADFDNDDGTIEYQLNANHTARIGRYIGEFVAIYADGTQRTSPNAGFVAIDVHEATDREGGVNPAEPNISASVVSVDEIQSNTNNEVTVNSPVQLNGDFGVRDLNVSDDGSTVTFSYNGTELTIDGDGIQTTSAPSRPDDLARQADIANFISDPLQSSLDANGHGIRNLADPGAADEAANKGYVDSAVDGVSGGTGGGGTVGHSGIVNAAEEGYPGDMSGGDVATLITNNPGKKIVFPPGNYSLQSQIDIPGSDADLVYIVGEPQATFVVDDAVVDRALTLGLTNDPIKDVRIENMTLQCNGTSSSNATWGRIYATGDVYTKNLHASGKVDRSQYSNDRFSLLCNMMDETAVSIHEGISFRDGEVHDTTDTNVGQTIGFGAEPSHVGTNILIGAQLDEWADNGFYVKDGTGSNILIGCGAYNCGGANFRIGTNDVVIGGETVWDADPTNFVNGTLLDSDESNGTAVQSLRAIRETGSNDCIRFRSTSESLSFRDLYIDNQTSEWSLSARGSGTASAVIDNATIIDSGDTAIRGAAVQANRDNLHLRDCEIQVSTTSWRGAVQVASGSCRITGGELNTNGAPYNLEIQSSDRVSLRDVEMNGGFYINGQPNALQVNGCDMRNVASGDIFYDTEPTGEFVWWNNLGHLSSTTYGEHYASVFEADTIRRSGENVLTTFTGERTLFVADTEPADWVDGDLWAQPSGGLHLNNGGTVVTIANV